MIVTARIRTAYPPREDWYDELFLVCADALAWQSVYAEMLEEAGQLGFILAVSDTGELEAPGGGATLLVEERSIEMRVARLGAPGGVVSFLALSEEEIASRRALLMSFGFRRDRPAELDESARRRAERERAERREQGYLVSDAPDDAGPPQGGIPDMIWKDPRIRGARRESVGYLASGGRRLEIDRLIYDTWLSHGSRESLIDWLLSPRSAAFMAFTKPDLDAERNRVLALLPDEIPREA